MKKYQEICITFIILSIMYNTVKGANYQRYGESTSSYPYSSYSTISNLYNQPPYKNGAYGSDIASFPEATRYPNYSPAGYTTPYSTQRSNVFQPGYQSTSSYQSNLPSYNTPSYRPSYGQGLGQGYTSYEIPFMRNIRDYCVDRSPQQGIWVDSLMGMWYGVEYIQHLGGDSREDYARSCIVIHIAEPMDRPSTENQLFHVQHINAKFRQEWRHVRLLWDEAGLTTEYALYFKNESAGYWQVFGGQNGTLAARPNYQQFSGTVQVLKAVNDHLVLNFCQEPTNGQSAQLYSVLFSREPGLMARWEVESIHNLLQNKKLSVASRRMVCGNSGHKALYSIVTMALSCVFATIIRTF